jgi:hypothetical protein
MAAWVRLDILNSFAHVITMSDLGTGYRLAAWAGNPTGYAGEVYTSYGDQFVVADGELPSLHEWTHVAVTWDAAAFSIYRNGELASTQPTFGFPISIASRDLLIGGLIIPNPPLRFFLQGDIDDVRIYDRALSASEIGDLFAVPEPGTLALLLSGFSLLAVAGRDR